MNSIIRTAVAILCGFLAMTIVVLVGTVAATALFIEGGVESLKRVDAPLPTLYLTANLAVSLAAAMLGGWLSSRLDAPGGWRPVFGLVLLVLVMSISNQAVPRGSSGAQLSWYPWAIVLAGVAGSLAGGWLRLKGRGAPAPPGAPDTFNDRNRGGVLE